MHENLVCLLFGYEGFVKKILPKEMTYWEERPVSHPELSSGAEPASKPALCGGTLVQRGLREPQPFMFLIKVSASLNVPDLTLVALH